MGNKTSNDDLIKFANTIENQEAWNYFSYQSKEAVFANTQQLKFVYILQSRKVIFFNSKHFQYHFDFVCEVLRPRELLFLNTFSSVNYQDGDMREYVLATIVYYKDQDKYAWELNAVDNLNTEHVIQVTSDVQTAFCFPLYYRPTSAQGIVASKQLSIPVLHSDDIYKGIKYQAYNRGVAFGRVRFISEQHHVNELTSTDIAVCSFVPLDIPVCAAIVTSAHQAPLCHVAILAQNRKSPNAFIANAQQVEQILALKDKPVKLEVADQNYVMEAATDEQVLESGKKKHEPIAICAPALTISGLLNSDQWARETAGMKAYHLRGMAKNISKSTNVVYFNSGFVVPFAYYAEHLQAAKIRIPTEKDHLTQTLRKIQELIQDTPVNPKLLELVSAKLQDKQHYIFRSSSNAEDLKDFNGAGLYESVILRDKAQIESTIKQVWMSVWSLKSFSERCLFQIIEQQVNMAVLVQPLIETSVYCKGVAITASPFKKEFFPYFINVQPAKGSVTDNLDNAVPEQLMLYFDEKQVVMEVLAQSSYLGKDSGPLLNKQQCELLYAELKKIHKVFKQVVDVEFIFDNSSVLYILQARPHQGF